MLHIYSISNFVSDLTDSQMVYWTLIPYNFSNSIGNAYIKIHANNPIDNSVGVWGYGNYGGTAYVYDGYIEMQSDGSLTTDEYMTILVQGIRLEALFYYRPESKHSFVQRK